jgi:hypothetical protein
LNRTETGFLGWEILWCCTRRRGVIKRSQEGGRSYKRKGNQESTFPHEKAKDQMASQKE